MKIKAKWEVSYTSSLATFDLEDVGCETEKEWNALTEDEQKEKIQEAIDDLCDSPSMILDRYNIII